MIKKILLPLITFGCIGVLSGCGEKPVDPKKVEPIKFVQTDNGKKLVMFEKFETYFGAFGVKIGYDDICDTSEIFSSNYSTVEEVNGKYVCTATVSSILGSSFKTIDTIYYEDGLVKVDRTFSVESEGIGDLGFQVYFRAENISPISPLMYKWFCPGNYYGNDEWTFTGVGCKTAFPLEEGITDGSVITNDNSSTPLLMCYDGKEAFAMLDTSEGFRETVATDYGVNNSKILIDDRLNLGGIGIKFADIGEEKHTTIFQNYPSFSSNFCGALMSEQYRMLPVRTGLTRSISFEFSVGEYASFYEAAKAKWRYSYNHYVVVDKRYGAEDVYKAVYENIGRSFGYIGGIPQYYCNTDHAYPDGGFLYRNSETAGLMLSIGRKIGNQKYIDDALTVMKNQIEFDRMDEGLIAAKEDLYTYRASNDALFNLCIDYKTELDKGFDHPEWLHYLLKKANKKLNSTYWVDAMFLSQFAKLTGSKTYMLKAIELMNTIKDQHLEMHYYGTISNPAGHRILEKEGGLISLTIYLNLYELTNNKDWLYMAERSAFHAETYQQIQPICIDSYDNPGYGYDELAFQYFNQGFMGNSRFLAYGISYVCSQVTSGDNGNAFDTPDFYRLYLYTQDQHYYDFYENVLYNSTLYVNMGDKVGIMDDILYSSGYGFQNEYFGLSNSGDPASYRRGSLHDSNLGWNMFAVLHGYERISNMFEDGRLVASGDDSNRTYDLKKNKYCRLTSDSYILDLNEFCHVKEIIGYSANVEYSIDGSSWTTGTSDFDARYVKFPTSAEIKNVMVMGLPLTYRALNYDDGVSVSPSSFTSAMDWNYKTSSTMTTNTDYVIDLGKEGTVSHIAVFFNTLSGLSFNIEVSSDGFTYTSYGGFDNVSKYLHVIENIVTNVRYIKIRNTSGRNLAVPEIKVMGI